MLSQWYCETARQISGQSIMPMLSMTSETMNSRSALVVPLSRMCASSAQSQQRFVGRMGHGKAGAEPRRRLAAFRDEDEEDDDEDSSSSDGGFSGGGCAAERGTFIHIILRTFGSASSTRFLRC